MAGKSKATPYLKGLTSWTPRNPRESPLKKKKNLYFTPRHTQNLKK